MPVPIAAGILAALLAGLSRVVATRAGQWCLAALASIGISFASYSVAIEPLTNAIANSMAGIPADAAAWMGYFWIDKGVSVVVSAYIAAMGVGALKRLTMVKRA